MVKITRIFFLTTRNISWTQNKETGSGEFHTHKIKGHRETMMN